MATAGETIENPVTGERFRWHQTASETGGRLVRHEAWIRPGGGVASSRYLLVVAREFEDEVYVTRPPLRLQRVLFGAMARMARVADVLEDVRFA